MLLEIHQLKRKAMRKTEANDAISCSDTAKFRWNHRSTILSLVGDQVACPREYSLGWNTGRRNNKVVPCDAHHPDVDIHKNVASTTPKHSRCRWPPPPPNTCPDRSLDRYSVASDPCTAICASCPGLPRHRVVALLPRTPQRLAAGRPWRDQPALTPMCVPDSIPS
jgi:hypothetical protein